MVMEEKSDGGGELKNFKLKHIITFHFVINTHNIKKEIKQVSVLPRKISICLLHDYSFIFK